MLIEIKIPVFAESVTEGTIAALHKSGRRRGPR